MKHLGGFCSATWYGCVLSCAARMQQVRFLYLGPMQS